MTPTSRAHLTCLCGAVEEPGGLLKEDQFPLPTDVCFCNPCRRTSGGLWWVGDKLRDAPSSLSKCTGYKSSPNVTRYFCSTCGSSVFGEFAHGVFSVSGGCIEQSPESKARGESWPSDIMKVDYLGYAGDSTDFRHAALLATIGGRDIPAYDQGPDGSPIPKEELIKRAKESLQTERDASDVLTAECHCRGVSLRIHRPKWDAHQDTCTNWIPGDAPQDRYRAGFCLCRSCRLGIGSTGFCPWIFVPPEYVFKADGQPVEFGLGKSNVDGLQDYISTKDEVKRSFCRTCGATFFYWADDRPQVVDIAVGVLRAPEGMAANNWLWWRSRIAYEEEKRDGQIVDALKLNAPS